jgi:hypothetical protein
VKSYRKNRRGTYSQEEEALRSLRDMPGIIRRFGSYIMESPSHPYTYHIILEFGRMDLNTHFYHVRPPSLTIDIIRFWRDMEQIAQTISKIHVIKYNQSTYHG